MFKMFRLKFLKCSFFYAGLYCTSLPADLLPFVNQARDKGASSWLNAILLEDQGLVLNKQEFRGSLRLRYNMPLNSLPNRCACGEKFSTTHALSCKKVGFVAQRHDGIRNKLTTVLSKVCNNVESESQRQPLDNERLSGQQTQAKKQGWTSRLQVSGLAV